MHNIELIVMLAASLTSALVFGYFTERLGLSPIVGYLFAGIAVGPFTPGFVADQHLAEQLAEVGVILLMFGVGLHFRLEDLLAVRKIAIPGAIGQILVSTLLGTLVGIVWGWSLSSGIVAGIAISVASTVVLMRVLQDNDVLHAPEGHIAVGWLIVEDIFTVLILVLLPIYAQMKSGGEIGSSGMAVIGIAILKLAALSGIMLLGGKRVIPWFLTRIARSRSRELFMLSVLAIAIVVATISALIFGASFALGAFLAGMVVGQSRVGNQAAADMLPIRQTFGALFFVSVGMLFDPRFLIENPGLILAILAIIIFAKPLTAMVLVIALGYSIRAAITCALALAQIGEFSFILSTVALGLGLFSQEGQNALITTALISISINPILFRQVANIERWIKGNNKLWTLLNRRVKERGTEVNLISLSRIAAISDKNKAVVVGYGPVGRTVTRILQKFDIHPVIIEVNIDTVDELISEGGTTIYGDATKRDIMVAAGVADASFLIITVPDQMSRVAVVSIARELNPTIKILVRARYLAEQRALEDLGASTVCYEEAEAAVSLSEILLRNVGVSEDSIADEIKRVRQELSIS